jgi:hypothetical protein
MISWNLSPINDEAFLSCLQMMLHQKTIILVKKSKKNYEYLQGALQIHDKILANTLCSKTIAIHFKSKMLSVLYTR